MVTIASAVMGLTTVAFVIGFVIFAIILGTFTKDE